MTKRIPLFNKIGQYGYVVWSQFDLQDTINVRNSNNQEDLIFTVNFNSNIAGCFQITEREAKLYEHPSLPMWLENKLNFLRAMNSEYFHITPLSAEIIPTLNCCFRCNQCSYRPAKEESGLWNSDVLNSQNKFTMSKSTMEATVYQLEAAGIRHVVFTGGGEPLINGDVTITGMKLCKKYGISFGLYTNGVFLSQRYIDQILAFEPEFIRISIYGMDSVRFSKYTGSDPENFNLVLDNIKSLLQKKEEKGTNTGVSLSFLVHPMLIPTPQYVRTLFDLFKHKEIKQFSMIRFTPAVDYYKGKQHDKRYFEAIFDEVVRLNDEYALENIVVYMHRINDLYTPKQYKHCFGNGFFAEVGPNGDLYLCCEKFADDRCKIGNLLINSIQTIWNSRERQGIICQIGDCKTCPNICKPHEINKQLLLLEQSKVSFGYEGLVKWREELIAISDNAGYFPGKLNAYES